MRGPSLPKTALLSFALHLTAFLIIFLVLRQSNHIIMSSPYTVSLISPDALTGLDKGSVEEGKDIDADKEAVMPVAPAEKPKKNKKETAKEKDMVKRKISAIEAKKKIEKIARLRSVISLKAGADRRNINSKIALPSSGKSAMSDDYYSKIIKEIHEQWSSPPGVTKKDIEAIISIRILKDGTAIVQKIEKSSGNTLFDKSAVRALAKASPLTPPPYEMEIGVRFYP